MEKSDVKSTIKARVTIAVEYPNGDEESASRTVIDELDHAEDASGWRTIIGAVALAVDGCLAGSFADAGVEALACVAAAVADEVTERIAADDVDDAELGAAIRDLGFAARSIIARYGALNRGADAPEESPTAG